jgi:MFS family permease
MKPHTYPTYLLTLLLLIYAFNLADRLAMGMALQSIKQTLYLTDTDLGFLTGLAFAACSAVVGIPIARWIDRGNRIQILVFTATVWSIMVALTGRAMNFAEILVLRVGVGIGDAGTFPAAQSLIPEHFSRAERPRATAMFMMGWPAALLLGFFVAGWINQFYGWRVMFLALSAPGPVLAALAWLTLREPRMHRVAHRDGHSIASKTIPAASAASQPQAKTPPSLWSSAGHPSMQEVIVTLSRNTTYRNLLLSYAVASFFSAGVFQWQPVFFMRSFGMRSGEVGSWLSLTLGVGSLLSIYAGGAIASRYAANNERLQFKVMAAAYVAFGIDHALAYLSPNAHFAFFLLGIGAFANAVSGPLLASIQTLVPHRMHAVSSALLLLLSNLIGLGLGPLAAGALSDAFRPIFGQDSLRYALLVLCPGFAWGAWHMWRASTTVTRDLEGSLSGQVAPSPNTLRLSPQSHEQALDAAPP